MNKDYNKEVMKHFLQPKNQGRLKNPDGVGKVGNPTCLLPDEKIHTNPDLLSINKIRKNDKVLDHMGSFNEISKITVREFDGKIIRLKNQLGTISLTPEHLIYAAKLPYQGGKYFISINKKKLIPAWYHAKNLERSDIILYPIPKKELNIEFIEFDIPRLKYDYKSNPLPKKIPLNGKFLRLCGYYLAEGHITEKKCNNCISFSFNINEKEYIGDVVQIIKDMFNIKPMVKYVNNKNTARIYVYSAGLARFFKKLFNKGAKNKKIPEFMMFLPIEKQKELLRGLWRGDGYVNLERKGPRSGYSTISYNLAQQIKLLLMRQKIAPSIYCENEKTVNKTKHQKSYRIHVGQRDSLQKLCKILGINYKPRSYASVTSWFDNNYFYTPLTKLQEAEYKGVVHNLEVENTHSFVSESFTLHNCGDIMHVYIKVDKNIIKDIKFETMGCVAAIATSSMITEMAKGKTLREAEKISRNDVSKSLKGLPPIKEHCSNLAADALRKAIEDYKRRKQ